VCAVQNDRDDDQKNHCQDIQPEVCGIEHSIVLIEYRKENHHERESDLRSEYHEDLSNESLTGSLAAGEQVVDLAHFVFGGFVALVEHFKLFIDYLISF